MAISQPPRSDWRFVEDLKTPLHTAVRLPRGEKRESEADLSQGVTLDFAFPDSQGCLDTACADFRRFMEAADIGSGPFRIVTGTCKTAAFEAFHVETDRQTCRIQANDSEGIRRGLVFVEDEIHRSGGPFLPLGSTTRTPVIRTRISRCFFGPIKRPPMNRDELADDADYYPDEYLNRLAHEAVNGLWLTVSFRDLCPSDLFPAHGADRATRLAKLRRTVQQCARYGIKVYVFCIEPMAFGSNPEYALARSCLDAHPELGGRTMGQWTNFCTSTATGQRYLEECSFFLFSHVPGLGGLIDINLGERPTHCYSDVASFVRNNCPRCSQRRPWEVFADTTSAIARGMQKANPDSEMISWLYVPVLGDVYAYDIEQQKSVIRDIAAHVPENVTLQCNFESNGTAEQLGKDRTALDYWLSWPGPSEMFRDCAGKAVRAGGRISAKTQVGCSHEVATVPFVPVPGNLYRKYKAMHELGVTTVMQCWYFGNYPGLMNKAAGELSFTPFPEDEESFLLKMARTDWGENAEAVVRAWQFFQAGYSHNGGMLILAIRAHLR